MLHITYNYALQTIQALSRQGYTASMVPPTTACSASRVCSMSASRGYFPGSTIIDDRGGVPMLVIVDDEALGTLRLPNHAHADFVCPTATPNELKARAQRLMGEEETVTADDVLNIDNLEINLATYQVTLDNEPIDLTLMEYSLLSFLATHPNRAYSREVLLHRVWGFEYCGGTRTVDVHIRRIRSKVGPRIAAHITTVRGVGYLFKD